MNKKRTKLLSDLKAISSHFKLNFSNIEFAGKSAFALDATSKKLLIIDADRQSYFKTIDLQNVNTCTVRFHYANVKASEIRGRRVDELVDKIELEINHNDPAMSVTLRFYDRKVDSADELRQLTASARKWRNRLNAILPLQHQAAA